MKLRPSGELTKEGKGRRGSYQSLKPLLRGPSVRDHFEGDLANPGNEGGVSGELIYEEHPYAGGGNVL